MSKRLIILVILFLINIPAYAQVDTAWVRRYNGPGNSLDSPHAIATDGSGNVYVTGESWGSGTKLDYATIKYYPNGDTAWVRRYNGPDNWDSPHAIAIDGSGNVYVTGESWNSQYDYEYATIKYYPDGDTAWIRRYKKGEEADGKAWAIAIDRSGNVCITGLSWTIKYYPNGDTAWVRSYPGSGAYAIATDAFENIYVTGHGSSQHGIDCKTIKYDRNGNEVWIKSYNGAGNYDDGGNALVLDNLGNVYVAGVSTSIGMDFDYLVIKYDQNGNELWAKTYNRLGNSFDVAWAIAVDQFENVYVTGTGTTIKYYSNGEIAWARIYNNTSESCWGEGKDIAVDDLGNVYVTGDYTDSSHSYCSTIKYDSIGNELWNTRSSTGFDSCCCLEAVAIALTDSDTFFVAAQSNDTGSYYGDFATIEYVQVGIISGTVEDTITQKKIDGALLEILQDSIIKDQNFTDSNGQYTISGLASGTYNIRATNPGYETKTFNGVNISAGQAVIQNFQLNSSPKDTLAYDDFSTQKTVIGLGAQTSMDWQTEGSCIWQVQDGTFRTGATGNRIFCLASSGEPTWTDYIYEADVYGIAGVDKAIEFRVQDYYNHYYVNLRSDWPNPGDDSIYFCKIVNGSCVDYYCVFYPSQNNTWYHLKVEAIGNHFKIYVDDNFVFEYIDQENTFPQGKIGLGCWTGDANICNIRFDNVLVGCWRSDFRPNPDGWKFANNADNMWPESWWQQFEDLVDKFPYKWPGCHSFGVQTEGPVCKSASTFPDWPLWVEVFGEDQCYMNLSGERVLDPVATRYWYDVSKSDDLPGWCFGFSLTASLFYNELILPGYYGELYELELNNGTRKLINSYHIRQYGMQFQDYKNANERKSTSQTLEEVRNMLGGCVTGLRFLLMRGFDAATGKVVNHAVVPWKVESHPIDPDTQYIFVYESGDPGNSNMKIKIYTPTDQWWYQPLNATRRRGLFLSPPLEQFLELPLLPLLEDIRSRPSARLASESTFYLQIYCSPNSYLRLTNSIGEEIGIQGDSLYSSLSDGMHIIPYGPYQTKPIGFYVLDDLYQLHTSHTSDSFFYFDIFGEGIDFFYERVVGDTTETDDLKFSQSDKWLKIINNDQNSKLFNLKVITASPDTYFVYGIDGCDLYFLDSLKFSSVNICSLKVLNNGSSKSYNLRVERVTHEEDRIFLHNSVLLEPNSSHLVAPDWSNPYIDSVWIYIDNNSDGTIDDTLIVENQYFTCGDVNGDKNLNVSDVIYLINYLFKGGPIPNPLEAGDVNCDGKVSVSDVIYLINYIFKGGPAPC